MNVLVMGGLGNMGRRYCAILRHLGHTPIVVDPAYATTVEQVREPFHHAIVATPTPTHLDAIREINRYRDDVAILCEKPVTNDLKLAQLAIAECEGSGNNLYVVNQYRYLPAVDPTAHGWSCYDYWNSGRDGLRWDCFQIIGLATGRPTLLNESPVWKCHINGSRMNIGDMDTAYVEMIKDFLGPREWVWGKKDIERVTRKVLEFENGIDRDPGAKH